MQIIDMCYFLYVDPTGKAVNGLLIIQALRPDRLTAMARVFVEKSLGPAFLHSGEKELNLSDIVENEVTSVLQNDI